MSGSCRKVVFSRAMAPLFQSARAWCTINSASCELILLPKPLSVKTRKRSWPKDTKPEKPCTAWPWMGKVPPELRGYFGSPTKVTPCRLLSLSVRARLASVNFPAVENSGPASGGAETVLVDGRLACPARTALTSVCACAKHRPLRLSAAANRRRRMRLGCFMVLHSLVVKWMIWHCAKLAVG